MQVSSLFTNNMVLQHGSSACIWGWGKKNETIIITFSPSKGCKNKKQIKKTKPQNESRWQIELDPLQISSVPATITIQSSNGETVTANNVVIGDVWLASGQSNMEWTVKDCLNANKEIASADWHNIRLFRVPKVSLAKKLKNSEGSWLVCNQKNVGEFSAVAYFFGREIHQTQNIPIGILNCSWGGTRIETWLSKESLLANEITRKETLDYEKTLQSSNAKLFQKEQEEFTKDPIAWLKKRVVKDPGNFAFKKGWANEDFLDKDWQEMNIPQTWQTTGPQENGVVWFRKWVNIPNNWVGKDITFNLGACDKHDVSYFNGVQVGAIGWDYYDPWNVRRSYTIPSHLVKPGKNLLTVRVYSYRNAGGLTGPSKDMFLELKDSKKKISIAGSWKYKMEHNLGVIRTSNLSPENNQNAPHTLSMSMLHSLVPYHLRGFLWYQGESNAATYASYRTTFPQLIREWRSLWGGKDLPFYFVQLASYISEGKWPYLREAQTMALKEKNTGMAVTIDIGEPYDIHPKNKQDVGKRLALHARKNIYGEVDLLASGPVYRNYQCNENFITIWFDFAEGLKAFKQKELLGFEIAGADQKFYPAKAQIKKDTVVVSSNKVKKPIAVRYAWADNPTCNLTNKSNLPASPFRTDFW